MPDHEKKSVTDGWGPEPFQSPAGRPPEREPAARSPDRNFVDVDPAPIALPVDSDSITPSVDGFMAVLSRRSDVDKDDSAVSSDKVGDLSDDYFLVWKRLWEYLTGPAAIALMTLLLGIPALFILTRAIELYATIRSLPPWEAWFTVAILTVCVTAMLSAIGYFIVGYCRLRHIRQIQLDQLTELSQRTSRKHRASMEALVSYLEGFDLGNSATQLPIGDDARNKLHKAKQHLLEDWRTQMRQTPDLWATRFVELFQEELDAEARSRVSRIAGLVCFKTAISPSPLVDTAIMLFWSFRLLGDLCRIYNLRVGAFGTVALLSRVFVVAYVAKELDETEEYMEGTLDQVLQNLPVPELARGIVSRISAKTGAGLANYLLIRRLGNRAIKMLQPVRT